MGKIAYENGDFVNSSLHLNDFLIHVDDDILALGAIKMLSEISLKNNNFNEALSILDRDRKYKFTNSSILDLKLIKANIFIAMNDSKNGKTILEEIDNQKPLPSHIKQRLEELYGMI